MSGIVDAAGGVTSVSSSSNTKNATKMFIPATHVYCYKSKRNINSLEETSHDAHNSKVKIKTGTSIPI